MPGHFSHKAFRYSSVLSEKLRALPGRIHEFGVVLGFIGIYLSTKMHACPKLRCYYDTEGI